jgi:NADH dehydrogenase [ubiquinone] 1 alpha subcomplex assembly factor 7
LTRLLDLLRRRIAVTGPLTVAEFMAEALGHPEFGYYPTQDPFGRGGDFVTSPEISQIFGELIGAWCGDLWDRMGRPGRFVLAEFGPGRGTLMADMMRALRILPEFGRAATLHLVETSPVLRRSQARLLAAHDPVWHSSANSLPDGPLIAIGNEFLDALPIRQFVRTETGWRERLVMVSPDGSGLAFTQTGPATPATGLIPPELRGAPPGSVCEVNAPALGIAAMLAERVRRSSGAVLFIDYGYLPRSCGDTLQAVRQHRYADILAEPGKVDLTAHVDFAGIAETAAEAGARVYGPVTQGEFLTRLGIVARRDALLRKAGLAQAEAIAGGCHRLIEPTEMGTLFKVLAIADPALPEPAGFAG